MRLIVTALVVLSLLAWLWRWGTRSVIHRNVPINGLRSYVESLLAQMGPGGYLIAKRRNGDGFLQLAMRGVTPDTYSVEFGLPEIDWSASDFEAVRQSITAQGFEATVELRSGRVSRFMRVVVAGSRETVIDQSLALFELVAAGLRWTDAPTFDVQFGGPLDFARIRAQSAAALRAGGA
jgi:hypothetical protein